MEIGVAQIIQAAKADRIQPPTMTATPIQLMALTLLVEIMICVIRDAGHGSLAIGRQEVPV
jgi:hypothetical protein